MYLLMGGQPICSWECGAEFRKQRFRCGTASFADKVYSRTSEAAKAFLLELLKPAQFQKHIKLLPCHLATMHMSHRWFFPGPDHNQSLDEMYDMIVMRRYDTWRNTLRLQINLFKLVADRITLAGLSRLHQHLQQVAEKGKVTWYQMQLDLQQLCLVPADLLKKVSKAYGDNIHLPTIHIVDFHDSAVAWRQKRVREVLWQVFNRGKCLQGTMSSEACMDGLTSGVLHTWSRPTRVLDIVFPLEHSSEGEHKVKLDLLIGARKHISYLELVAKTDAVGTLSFSAPSTSEN